MRGRAFGLLIAVAIGGVVTMAGSCVDRGGDDPALVLEAFFRLNAAGRLQSREARALLAGEAASDWTGPSIAFSPASADRIVRPADDEAVAAATVRAAGRDVDLYFYLERTDRWRITALRTMAGAEEIEDALAEAEAGDLSRHASLTEARRKQMRLALASDLQLEAWFHENRDAIRRLAEAADSTDCTHAIFIRNDVRHPVPDAAAEDDDDPFIHGGQMYVEELLRELHVTSVTYEPGGNLQLDLGGMLGDSVHILYTADDRPPRIDPASHIWVQELEPRWYLCRTS